MGRNRRGAPGDAGRRFLIDALVGAINTANARRPLSMRGRSSIACFFPSWLTSEMPLHAIAWQSVSTLWHIRRGALRTRAGWVGMAVTVASWWGLVSVWRQGEASEAVLSAALDEALGDDARVEPAPDEAGAERRARRHHLVLGPADYPRRRWVHDGRLTYGDRGRRSRLDIWRSPDRRPGDRAPVLVQVHGGAWVIGNKDQQGIPLMARLAAHGWVCVAINYPLSPRATWPDHIVEVKRALAWTKEHIADYGGDPDFVAITGGSAGGHLCSLAALTANVAEFQPGFEDADTSVACAVPYYGVYDFTNRDGTGRADMQGMLADLVFKVQRHEAPEVWDHASTMSWVSPDAPPFFVLHGTNDVLVPVEQARSFVRMLRAVSSQTVAYAELPGAQHAFDVFASPRSLAAAAATEVFLTAIHDRYASADRPVAAK